MVKIIINILSLPFKLIYLVITANDRTLNSVKIDELKKDHIRYLITTKEDLQEKTTDYASAPFVISFFEYIDDQSKKTKSIKSKVSFFENWDFTLLTKKVNLKTFIESSKKNIDEKTEELKKRAEVLKLISKVSDEYKDIYLKLDTFDHKDSEKINFRKFVDMYRDIYIEKEKSLVEFDYSLNISESKQWLNNFLEETTKIGEDFKDVILDAEKTASKIQKNINWINKIKPSVQELADEDYYEAEKFMDKINDMFEIMNGQMFDLKIDDNNKIYKLMREDYDSFTDKASARILHKSIKGKDNK